MIKRSKKKKKRTQKKMENKCKKLRLRNVEKWRKIIIFVKLVRNAITLKSNGTIEAVCRQVFHGHSVF